MIQTAPRFLQSEFADGGKDALFQIIPVPLEKSVSFGSGTSLGPQQLLVASSQLEVFDGHDVPGIRGLATLPEHPCDGEVEQVLEALAQRIQPLLQRRLIPVLFGGEHTVSLAAFLALERHFAPQQVGIVQIDAHADLRDSYQNNRYSHACVMKRALDLGFRLHQLGVRSLSPTEQNLRLTTDAVSYQDALELNNAAQLQLPEDFPPQVYLSIDVDGLDPAVIPATGTPEPGGLGWYPCLELLRQLAEKRKIIGFDLVELAPHPSSMLSEFTAARLAYQVMGLIGRQREE